MYRLVAVGGPFPESLFPCPVPNKPDLAVIYDPEHMLKVQRNVLFNATLSKPLRLHGEHLCWDDIILIFRKMTAMQKGECKVSAAAVWLNSISKMQTRYVTFLIRERFQAVVQALAPEKTALLKFLQILRKYHKFYNSNEKLKSVQALEPLREVVSFFEEWRTEYFAIRGRKHLKCPSKLLLDCLKLSLRGYEHLITLLTAWNLNRPARQQVWPTARTLSQNCVESFFGLIRALARQHGSMSVSLFRRLFLLATLSLDNGRRKRKGSYADWHSVSIDFNIFTTHLSDLYRLTLQMVDVDVFGRLPNLFRPPVPRGMTESSDLIPSTVAYLQNVAGWLIHRCFEGRHSNHEELRAFLAQAANIAMVGSQYNHHRADERFVSFVMAVYKYFTKSVTWSRLLEFGEQGFTWIRWLLVMNEPLIDEFVIVCSAIYRKPHGQQETPHFDTDEKRDALRDIAKEALEKLSISFFKCFLFASSLRRQPHQGSFRQVGSEGTFGVPGSDPVDGVEVEDDPDETGPTPENDVWVDPVN